MTITAEAADLVRDALRTSPIAHPVVYLAQISNTPLELDQAVRRGAGPAELREIASRTLASETRYLYPVIYPRSNFLWVFTTRIAGLCFAAAFFYPRSIRRALKTGVLDVAQRGLVLKDADGNVVVPATAT